MKKPTNSQYAKKAATPVSLTAKSEVTIPSEPEKEKIDPKKLIIYSEIMSPKFKD